MPNPVEPTVMVCPPRPLGVVHAVCVAGGGQKPTFGSMMPSAKAGRDKTKTNSETTAAIAHRDARTRFTRTLTTLLCSILDPSVFVCVTDLARQGPRDTYANNCNRPRESSPGNP